MIIDRERPTTTETVDEIIKELTPVDQLAELLDRRIEDIIATGGVNEAPDGTLVDSQSVSGMSPEDVLIAVELSTGYKKDGTPRTTTDVSEGLMAAGEFGWRVILNDDATRFIDIIQTPLKTDDETSRISRVRARVGTFY